MSLFPHVRGGVLAAALRRLGVDAVFRLLPVEGEYDVAISSDYQGDAVWLAKLQRHMLGLTARRFFCMADYGGLEHFSAPMKEWFAARGGVLCHLASRPFAPAEHYVGLGVADYVHFDAAATRDRIVFDFPANARHRSATSFEPRRLDAIRRAHPGLRLVGTGPADEEIRVLFDEWVAYGQPHERYVEVFRGCLAYVAGCHESLGLAAAEAQVSGAAILAEDGWLHPEMVVPSADLLGRDDVTALAEAKASDGARIAAEAAARFSAEAMARRVLAVITSE